MNLSLSETVGKLSMLLALVNGSTLTKEFWDLRLHDVQVK